MNLLTTWQQLANQVLSIEQLREVDRHAIDKYHMNSLVLMENAALGCVRWLDLHFDAGTTVVILCGRGNNGGDGLAIARHLRVLGWTCHVLLSGPAELLSRDARANWQILDAGGGQHLVLWPTEHCTDEVRRQVAIWIATADVVIDAMLGTGASGVPRTPYCDWIQLANASKAYRVAIDIPSGWNAANGIRSEPTFVANATLTFVAKKPAMVLASAASILGELVVLPIGIPEEYIRELLNLAIGTA